MFECDKCGLCCLGLNKSEVTKELHNGDGICINLDLETMLCRIYEERPIICRVEDYYSQHLSDKMDKEEFMRLNYKGCELKKKEWEECGRDIYKMISVIPDIGKEKENILKESLKESKY